MKPGSSSAVAKWVIAPASRSPSRAATASATRVASPASRVPSRPMPESSLTWTATPSGRLATNASRQATTSARAATATSSSSGESAPITSTGPSSPASRSPRASSAVATASQLAPPACARTRGLDHPVAVAVRLDDRAQLRGPRNRGKPPRVALDGAQVDPGQCPQRHR